MITKQLLVVLTALVVVAVLVMLGVGFDPSPTEASPPEEHGAGPQSDPADPGGVDNQLDSASRSAVQVEADIEPPAPGREENPQLWVRVMDSDDRPVEGSRVVGLDGSSEIRIAASSETDAMGIAALESPQDWLNTMIVATRGDRMSIPRRLRRMYGEVALQLQSTRRLSCIVVDGTSGEPLAAARVEVNEISGSTLREASSDTRGRVELGSWPVGLHAGARAELEGYVPTEWKFSVPDTPESNLVAPRVELLPARILSGRVVDAESGAPIPQARVTTDSNGQSRGPSCNLEGRFELTRHVPSDARSVVLRVSAPGYTEVQSEVDAEDWDEEIQVRMPKLAVLVVSIVLPDGTPCRASVLTHSDLDQGHPIKVPKGLDEWLDEGWTLGSAWSHLQPVENAEGHRTFEVFRVPFSDALRLTAVDGKYEPAHVVAPPAGPPGSRSSFEVQLRDPSDKERTAEIRGTLFLNGVGTRGFVHWVNGRDSGYAETNEEGVYALAGIVPGDVQLMPMPHGSLHGRLGFYFKEGMPFANQRPRLRVHAGEKVDLDINLEIEFGSIRGSVVDAHGVPLEGISMQIESLSSPLTEALPLKLTPFAETSTDESGEFEFAAPLEIAPYRVTLMQGCPIVSRDVKRAPAGGLRFEARPTVHVSLHMRTPSGPVDHPGPDVYVLFDGADSFQQVDPSLFRNRAPYEFELPAGTHDFVMARLPGIPARMDGVALEPSERDHRLEARFEPGFRLRAKLDDPARPIPEGVVILLLEEDKWSQIVDPLEPGGRGAPYPALVPSHIRGLHLREGRTEGSTWPLPPGRYRFKVFPPDITIEPEYVEVGNSDQHIEIDWR